jgi:hypothetical protein
MTAFEILERVRVAGGRVSAEGDRLRLRAPSALPNDVMTLVRDHKAEILQIVRDNELKTLTEEYKRNGRIRIEGPWEGGAWLVVDYDHADDITEGGVYSEELWPDFVKLDPEHKVQIHEFLCQLGGGRFGGLKK